MQASISEAQRRIEEVQLNARNLMSAELSETMSRLSALNEGDRALADKVQAYTERAVPADARDAPRRTIAHIRLQAAMKDRQVPVLEAWLREPSHSHTR